MMVIRRHVKDIIILRMKGSGPRGSPDVTTGYMDANVHYCVVRIGQEGRRQIKLLPICPQIASGLTLCTWIYNTRYPLVSTKSLKVGGIKLSYCIFSALRKCDGIVSATIKREQDGHGSN